MVGNVSAIELDETGVLVRFKIGTDVRLGDRTEAAIKTKSLLGTKIVDVTPRGSGQLEWRHSARSHRLALPAARCPRRLGHHDQRSEHQPAVGLAGHLGADVFGTPHQI